jgi:hypothetical protein
VATSQKRDPMTTARSQNPHAESGNSPPYLEPHHTIKELAERWNLDRETVRRLVFDRDDVLKIAHTRRNAKRDYVSYRIPQSVARKIYHTLLGRSE